MPDARARAEDSSSRCCGADRRGHVVCFTLWSIDRPATSHSHSRCRCDSRQRWDTRICGQNRLQARQDDDQSLAARKRFFAGHVGHLSFYPQSDVSRPSPAARGMVRVSFLGFRFHRASSACPLPRPISDCARRESSDSQVWRSLPGLHVSSKKVVMSTNPSLRHHTTSP